MSELFVRTLEDYAVGVVPWFVFGALAAYLVERRFSSRRVSALLGTLSPRRVFGALALGMVSPLSIMSQLPVSGSLTRLGANPALLLAFLAAERSYDFQSFPIIAGFFGMRFAALNAAAVFLSLLAATLFVAKMPVAFKASGDGRETGNGFWIRQGKLFAVVIVGVVIASVVRSVMPEDLFRAAAQSDLGGLATGTAAGLALYFGTILGNYPVAKAFADLGMSPTGVFAFLTVSPLFNAVVLTMFASAAHWRHVARFFAAYAVSALAMSAIIGVWLL
jgi:uncharacterized membrane protein YraQ (UPF0718 family)